MTERALAAPSISEEFISFKAMMNSNNRIEGEGNNYILNSENNILHGNLKRRIKQEEQIAEYIIKIKSERERNHPLTRVGNFLNHGVFKVVGKLSQLLAFKDDLEFIGNYEERFKSILDFAEIEHISIQYLNSSKRSLTTPRYLRASISLTHSLDSLTTEQQNESAQQIANNLNELLGSQLIKGRDFFPIEVISDSHFEIQFSPLVSARVGQTLKSHPNVHYVEKVHQLGFFNKNGVSISQSVNANSVARASPFYDLGIYGEGQIIGLSDTGIDHDHCFFRDSSNVNVFDENHRKIVSYNTITFQFNNQKITTDFKDDVSGHGTHVAGSISGSMENTDFSDTVNQYHGMAPASKLFFVDMKDSNNDNMFMSNDLTVLFKQGYNYGARIFSNSYGTSASVYVTCSYDCKNCRVVNAFDSFNSGDSITDAQCNRLFGSETCCSITNFYTSSAYNLDKYLWDKQDAVILFAAGNDGALAKQGTLTEQSNSKNIISVGSSRSSNSGILTSLYYEDYYTKIKEASLNFAGPEECCLSLSTNVRSYCCPSYVENQFKDTKAYNEMNIASFSSRGPADGGRIKPDLVAVGENIVSAHSDGIITTNQCGTGRPKEGNDAALLSKRGTSMSTPLMAGAAALIRQYLQKNRGVSNPSGPLIKALLVQSAVPSKGTVSLNGDETDRVELNAYFQPNPVEGHGIVSLGSLLKTETGNDVGLTFFENSFTASSQSFKLCYKVESASWIKATLAWYDYPSDISSFVPLINNLDLIVNTFTTDGTSFKNLVVYGGNDLGAVDTVNNLEKVIVNSLGAASYVSVAVYMNQLASVTTSQPYALVLTSTNGTLVQVNEAFCTYSKDVPPRAFRPNIVAAIVIPIVFVIVFTIIVIIIIIVILILRFTKKNEIQRKKSVNAAAISESVMPEMQDFTPTY
ncbi:predicted protein [Naegleria gruberi]|uniref:Predicted protein n=1 Tax=Naegleria gruberi TaxID=5762 RepID=D2V1R2_NAEGR|nr:uncharacterized protein NAEGRDRAFT_62665 [Naegleria gruberi]EFC49354.1 predicted protein [Naegleria gruberi]|eukprot:XP_002682098.1 predicted protein [Naegleria gruberi strain NEG-M]